MARFTEFDALHMDRALALARRAKGRTRPNPAVGAVITRGNAVVGQGSTQRCGGPHAEVMALRQAGRKAQGATMYVTLEPCCHHGRTPPCTDRIVSSGIRRVVVAISDPNPLVAGKGVRQLRKAGIDVARGLRGVEARAINEDYFWAITERRPWVCVKLAVTLDGRIADHTGKSKWITNAAARSFVQHLRGTHAAVAVGAATLRADNPRLTVRCAGTLSPARVVFARSPRAGRRSRFRRTAGTYRSILVCPGARAGMKSVCADGVEVWRTGRAARPENLRVFEQMAFDEGMTSILVEGGRELASSFLEAGMVNRLYLFYGNRLLGGGLEAIRFHTALPLARGQVVTDMRLFEFDGSFAVTGTLKRRS
ncbi:MAG: bifunctional diaminohydroxyphosphoribosylaminopyrimidine deaminase/5-amino-6-(5-phosphoribosylamino)uracil reductase RibD [Chitinivibrionales bacterium]|nr:bifunctional diaminohydroxyphosphoribosylaminopyrimidine deaminase/5-amino-6-(5-phosphoribosylamino)uracil reductase RibD [Chitinivibrionales bacterium]MBD3396998.1 bifunctional diaminohydroxyphosphoribosylaminopyrimidine deaminase/5-amino-6-(5-phosphoribosylamino)uracil reductase RibD [Chitinivibrionales bacterium]